MIDQLLDHAWWTTARITTLAACVSAFVALIGVPFLALQARNAARDSRARSRPIVTATLVRTPYTKSYAIKIANSGPSSARDLTVAFDPPLPGTLATPDGQQSVIPFMAARYARPIPVFPPGAELSNVYYVGTAGAGGKIVNAEATEDAVTVTLAYRDDDGHRYTDAFPLDVDILRKETESVGSKSPQKQREQALKNFNDLIRWVKVAAQSLDELTSLGVRRRTRQADRRREAQDAAQARADATLMGRTAPPERRTVKMRRATATAMRRAATRIHP